MDRREIKEHRIKFHPTGGFVYDFDIACNVTDIKHVLDEINRNGYALINVVPCDHGCYMIFFRRPAHG